MRRAGLFGGLLGLGAILKYRTQLFLIRPAPTEADKPRPEWRGARVRAYRPLGRTGWKMSDISMGAAHLRDPDVVRLAIDRGINYIDTSPDYSDAQSERAVGEGIRGHREKVFVASKFCTPKGHLPEDARVPDIIAAVEASLRRLGTDYIDLLHIHACNSIERLMAPNFHEAFDKLKEQGKARFLGVSSHTPELEKVMRKAVDCGRFDVIMVAYNFNNWPDLREIMKDAHERGVGVVAMKTLKGAYHTVLKDFEPNERNSFTQAAFKWVNSNPYVSGLVVSISKPSQLDEYLYASGGTLSKDDLSLLDRYDALIAGRYCQPGCGECLSHCPASVPVDDILRYAMYFETYGAEKDAISYYARLLERRGQGVESCLSCAAPCQAACPFGIAIRERLLSADRLLRV
ncbi:MAG: hypothetical protein D6815_07870 [Candidatus Dadabacteria bacterium]|nr:MAG: hypothetical protein D6815_07870 [Candidatus Dadabacteria bacterium]